MRKAIFFSVVTALQALAVPLERRTAPTVTLSNGKVTGGILSEVEYFNGIPYAQPPVGSLRLKAPQPITSNLGNVDGTNLLPKACPQFYQTTDTSELPSAALGLLLDTPLFQTVSNAGEDCLTLNVIRPAGVSSSAKLPVLVWIFGGAFELGSTQMYKGETLVQRSISLNAPIIYVAINYRVGGFGFLGGKEMAGNANLGLRDQRLALQWVQDNIASFGGDASKVTIWGESAGAISVFDHTIINGGDNTYNGKPLFRGGIMNSGSIIPADPIDAPQPQGVYNTVVKNAGCSDTSDTLACLRAADYTTLLNAMNSVPAFLGYRSADLAYLPRPDPTDNFFPQSPELAVAAGTYSKIPVIIGDQEDEGTIFSLFQGNITTNSELIDYLTSAFDNNPNAKSLVTGLVATYPQDLGISGSPFGTTILNNLYPQYKRLAAILGDLIFNLARRAYLAQVASSQPCWSYQASYLYGTPVLGTFHASDILYSFGYFGDNVPTTTLQTAYIAFTNKLDPNALGTSSPLINWPKWTASSPQLMKLSLLSNSLIKDDFRQDSYNYLTQHKSDFRT